MEALGRVELPTNGLGNVGQGLLVSRIKDLQTGFRCLSREKSSHSALNCQRICQREPAHLVVADSNSHESVSVHALTLFEFLHDSTN